MKSPHTYVAELLSKLPAATVADVLDSWVSVWDEPELFGYTEEQAEDIEKIHWELCRIRQDARELAVTR